MAHIVLFHSALGLRPGVQHFADALRKAGHAVTTPDLYDGEVFDSFERAIINGSRLVFLPFYSKLKLVEL